MKFQDVPYLYKLARDVKKATGKPVSRQIIEMIALRFRKHPTDFSEYYDLGIWNPGLSASERREFIGWRLNHVANEVLNDGSFVLAGDKLINYILLDHLGFPIPEIIAVYNKQGRQFGTKPTLKNAQEVLEFVKNATSPFFVKPVSAGTAKGSYSVEGWDDKTSKLVLANGERIAFDDFFSDFDHPLYGGMIFQSHLKLHPEIQQLTGTRTVSGLRIVCLLSETGPLIHSAVLKLAAGRSSTDNFDGAKAGNVAAWVNAQTGRVEHAISKFGIGGEISTHPSTGKEIVGFAIPNWEQTLELVQRVAVHFPGMRCQSWDVAICESGPVLLEVNARGGLQSWQGIAKRGLMDPRFAKVLEKAENTPSIYRTDL